MGACFMAMFYLLTMCFRKATVLGSLRGVSGSYLMEGSIRGLIQEQKKSLKKASTSWWFANW
jgi:hypothetical protein